MDEEEEEEEEEERQRRGQKRRGDEIVGDKEQRRRAEKSDEVQRRRQGKIDRKVTPLSRVLYCEEAATPSSSSSSFSSRADDDDEEEEHEAMPCWKFIAERGGVYRDIFEKHIVGKLNGTDAKFLYSANTESRAAIKSFLRDKKIEDESFGLPDTFKVYEMSSISTLKLAWENYPWDEVREIELDSMKREGKISVQMNQERFCYDVAQTERLDLLRWVREVKNCACDSETVNCCAYDGNLDMVKYCVENGCPIDEFACVAAAINGNLEILIYLHEDTEVEWTFRTGLAALISGNIECFEYCKNNGCKPPTEEELLEEYDLIWGTGGEALTAAAAAEEGESESDDDDAEEEEEEEENK